MTERTPLADLNKRVVSWFRRRARRLGLRPEAIQAQYILNWGGFVNASFTVTDGEHSFHLKLADEEWSLSRLENWRVLKEILTARYHAPTMLEWVEIPGTSFGGPLFEHISARPLDLSVEGHILQQVMDLLVRLHTDEDLAGFLAEDEEEDLTCWEYFASVYIDRFDEDLRIVAADLPPFVSLALLDWMQGETRELEGIVRTLPVFSLPARSPTHGDLWSSNILVTVDERWYIIDWDDLALGDPALEYAILLGPLWRRRVAQPVIPPVTVSEIESMLPSDPQLRERFRICLRAFLLDEVIDSLADWVECEFSPEHREQVRAEKERKHHDALALYQKIFP